MPSKKKKKKEMDALENKTDSLFFMDSEEEEAIEVDNIASLKAIDTNNHDDDDDDVGNNNDSNNGSDQKNLAGKNNSASTKAAAASTVDGKKKPTLTISMNNEDVADNDNDDDIFELVLNSRSFLTQNSVLAGPNAERTILVQMDTNAPSSSAKRGGGEELALDFEGSTGAIGRLEANDRGVLLDLKGRLYQGRILPGPTAWVMVVSSGGGFGKKDDENHPKKKVIKIESVVDEFCRMSPTGSALAKLKAVTSGKVEENIDDDSDDGDNDHEEDGDDKRGAARNKTKKNAKKNVAVTTTSGTPANAKPVTKKAAACSKKLMEEFDDSTSFLNQDDVDDDEAEKKETKNPIQAKNKLTNVRKRSVGSRTSKKKRADSDDDSSSLDLSDNDSEDEDFQEASKRQKSNSGNKKVATARKRITSARRLGALQVSSLCILGALSLLGSATVQGFSFPSLRLRRQRYDVLGCELENGSPIALSRNPMFTFPTLVAPIRNKPQQKPNCPRRLIDFGIFGSPPGFLWRKGLVLALFFMLSFVRAADASTLAPSLLRSPLSALWRQRRAILRVAFVVLMIKLVVDRIAVRRRQKEDPTSEWERYARRPGARGRALMSLIFLQVLPLWAAAKLVKADKLMAFAGRVLTEGLLRLGPLYCKVGQILSCQEESLPTSWIKSLEKLQDQIPAQTGEKALKLAKTAWAQGLNSSNPSFEQIFVDFDTKPLAAASLGQVHKAVLRSTNETVAIKLQRPFLRQIYDQDMSFLTKMAKAVDRFAGKAGKVGGVEQSWEDIFLDAEAILYREIDYRDEAENGIRFCRDFGLGKGGKKVVPTAIARDGKPLPSASPWLRAPYVYGNLTSEKVLVMEFVPSIKITNLAKLDAANVTAEEREYLADCLGRAYLRQFCSHKFFSTDPHPGNLGCEILEVKKSSSKSPKRKAPTKSLSFSSSSSPSERRVRLVFYDFGQAAELTQGQADGILEIIEAIVDMDVDKSMEAFQQMGVLKPGADLNKVRAKVADNYKTGKVKANRKRLDNRGYQSSAKKKSTNRSSTTTAPGAVTNSTNSTEKVRDAEVMGFFTLPAGYAFVGRALTQMAGVGKTLDSEFDFISSAAPWIYEIKGATQYLKEELAKKLEKWGLADIMPTYVDGTPPWPLFNINSTKKAKQKEEK